MVNAAALMIPGTVSTGTAAWLELFAVFTASLSSDGVTGVGLIFKGIEYAATTVLTYM